jgi:hypothetical protein
VVSPEGGNQGVDDGAEVGVGAHLEIMRPVRIEAQPKLA